MKKIIFIVCFGLSAFLRAQENASHNCMERKPALYDLNDLQSKLCKQINITQSQCFDFLRYAAKYNLLGMHDYNTLLKEKVLTKRSAQKYWDDRLPYLVDVYKYKYLPSLSEEIPKTAQVNQKTESSCYNLDFSQGNMSNWSGKWNNSPSQQAAAGAYGPLNTTGFNSNGFNDMGYVHEICTGGVDRNVPINAVPPGHSYSLRLGDDSAYMQNIASQNGANGGLFPYNHQSVSNTFMVSPSNETITYWYAVALGQNISAPHQTGQQPFFRIRMYDQNGTEITCAHYDVDVTQAQSIGFSSMEDPTGTSEFYYKDWTQVLIPLKAYLGQNVTITFETCDCYAGGHFGYAYIAVDCAPLQLITQQPQPCIGGVATMTAPSGLASYNWSGPGLVGSHTAPTVTANVGGTYTVTMTTFANTGQTGCTLTDTCTIQNSTINPVASFTANTVCLHQTTQFTDQSVLLSNQGTINSWHWNFGNGNTSTSYNPTNLYSSPGTYSVTYTITTSAGCSGTYTSNVIVNPLPTVSFTDNIVCVGAPTSFTNTTTGATSYTWTFGDGGTDNTQNPTHTYTSAGNFNVNLSVVNAEGCSDHKLQTVTVLPYPTVNFSASSVCFGSTTQFSNSSTPTTNVLYNWNFGDGSTTTDTSSIKNPSYTYPQPGVYSPTLTVTSLAGCSTTQSYTVQVKPLPSASASLNPSVFCWNDVVPQPTVTSNPATGVSYSWVNSNTAIGLNASGNGIPPVFTAAINTTGANIVGTITMTPNYNGCPGQPTTYSVTVKPTPVVTQPSLNYCPGDTVPMITFSATPAPASANITWTANTTPYIGLNTTSGTTTLPQFYAISNVSSSISNVVTVSDNYNGCVGPNTTFSITINANPTAMFTYTNACSGNPTNFIDQSIAHSGFITQWNWNFGTGTSTSPAPAYLLTPAGTYTVHLQVTSNVGCKDDTTETVTVLPSPTLSFGATPLAGCTPLITSFADTVSANPQVVSWYWNFGNGAAITYPDNTFPEMEYTNPSHTQSSFYSVGLSVTANNGCVTTVTKNDYIEVYPRPKANFTYGPKDVDIITQQVNFYDQSIGVGGNDDSLYNPYQWNFGDAFVSEDSLNYSIIKNPTHLYQNPSPSEYSVTEYVQNQYGCRDSITEIIVIHDAVTFYIPNAFSPNHDGKNEIFKGTGIGVQEGTYTLEIFDRWGLLIFHADDLETGWDGTYHNNPVQEDVYVWKVSFEDVLLQYHKLHGTVTLVR